MKLVAASRFSIEQLVEAYNQTRIDYLVPMPMTARRLQEYVDVYDIDLGASVVALDSSEILGLCMLGLRADRAWITRLGVLPTSRRHGAGQAMMEYEIGQAIGRGVSAIYLEVITGNAPAYRLFTRLGFEDTRSLLVLRRPPSPSSAPDVPANATYRWLAASEALAFAAQEPALPAWTNQVESLGHVASLRGLHGVDHADESSGWLAFEPTALQIRRVTLGALNGHDAPPADALLAALHHQFPRLDTIAENIPADASYLPAFTAHRYVASFSRIEMKLTVKR